MSGSLVSIPPGLPVNDFSGRRAVLATVDDGDGRHVLEVSPVATATTKFSASSAGAALTAGGVAESVTPSTDTILYVVIQNPPDATSQGIATAENLFVGFDGAVVNGAGNFAALAPGQSCTVGFPSLPLEAGVDIMVNAATTGHIYLATIIERAS